MLFSGKDSNKDEFVTAGGTSAPTTTPSLPPHCPLTAPLPPPHFPLTALLLPSYCSSPPSRRRVVRRRLEAYAVEARARSLLRRRASLPWIPSPPHPPSSPGTWSPAPPTLLLPGDFFPDYSSYLQASCSTSTASRVAITSSRAGPRAWWRAPRRPRWHSPSPPPRRQRQRVMQLPLIED